MGSSSKATMEQINVRNVLGTEMDVVGSNGSVVIVVIGAGGALNGGKGTTGAFVAGPLLPTANVIRPKKTMASVKDVSKLS